MFDVDAELSISKKNLCCKEVARTLASLGISSKVSSNDSVSCNSYTNNCRIEEGCTINLCGLNRTQYSRLWLHLKTRFQLDCAHLKIDGQYTGCIYSYLKTSNCPKS
mgnify:CR=1 FL=1